MARQGAFYDLKPLIEEYAPHIKAYLEANPDYVGTGYKVMMDQFMAS